MDKILTLFFVLTTCTDVDAWYAVAVKTSGFFLAGTDAHVDIKLYGHLNEHGTPWIRLNNPGRNDFEMGSTDVFTLLANSVPYLGEIYQITIKHDSAHAGPDWHLEWVHIVDYNDMNNIRSYPFPCHCWIEDPNPTRTITRTVDGRWADYGSYSQCSKTCGPGTKTRRRSCIGPYNGGSSCRGSSSQSASCFIRDCPIHGQWSSWSSWQSCSAPCGGGTRTRVRTCTNPRPQHGGADCSGASSGTQSCNSHSCPVHGGWTAWSSWGDCSVSCGGGARSRSRACTDPTPAHGGLECLGESVMSEGCGAGDCPVHGGWTAWSDWSACSVSCGDGVQSSSRTCTNPTPANGGDDCAGGATQSQSCSLRECPIDGGWTEWSQWSECSETCGAGVQTSTRSCTNPAPAHDGQGCVGGSMKSESCKVRECPVDGGWSRWGNWSECSETCGIGVRRRERQCSDPVPQYGGLNCTGSTHETHSCLVQECPIDGAWNAWSSWSTCSETCGNGTQTRQRTCANPQHGGSNCTGANEERQSCKVMECPINGGWDVWASWSACSTTCGNGTQDRLRTCTKPIPQYGGLNCSGDGQETQICAIRHCPVDGIWGEWSEWSRCSKSCGGGEQHRSRSCDSPSPAYGGRTCLGNATSVQQCQKARCPVDGGWTSWSEWTSCTVSCGGGVQESNRSCSYPEPAYGGGNCSGGNTRTQSCNTYNCPVDGGWSTWSAWGDCSATCGAGEQTRNRSCSDPQPAYNGEDCIGARTETQECNSQHCPVDGEWGTWGGWSSCSETCGGGTQISTRVCDNPPPEYGGVQCSDGSARNRTCNTHACPVDGRWTDWSEWGNCSMSCGGGQQLRTRTCTNPPPAFNGRVCAGDGMSTRSCNTHNCPIDGAWGPWGAWSDCTAECDGGQQTRNRTCTEPQHDGRDCGGPSTNTRVCNIHNCPVHGGWTDWSSWTDCSATCEGGRQSRDRACTNPQPAHGGYDCQGPAGDTRACNTQNCPVDGIWTRWSSWTGCSLTCGSGHQSRERTCADPQPHNGGRDCEGSSATTRICNTHNCPVDGGWSHWSIWSVCPVCGGGQQARTRTCTQPPPQYGGGQCDGGGRQDRACTPQTSCLEGWSDWGEWSVCSASCDGGVTTRQRTCYTTCDGDAFEAKPCNSEACPVDGAWSKWTDWSQCSKTCGYGVHERTRACDDPAPTLSGKNCQGGAVEKQECYEEVLCEKTQGGVAGKSAQEATPLDKTTSIAIGATVGGLVLIILIAVIIGLRRRRAKRSRQRSEEPDYSEPASHNPTYDSNVTFDSFGAEPEEHIYDYIAEHPPPDYVTDDVGYGGSIGASSIGAKSGISFIDSYPTKDTPHGQAISSPKRSMYDELPENSNVAYQNPTYITNRPS